MRPSSVQSCRPHHQPACVRRHRPEITLQSAIHVVLQDVGCCSLVWTCASELAGMARVQGAGRTGGQDGGRGGGGGPAGPPRRRSPPAPRPQLWGRVARDGCPLRACRRMSAAPSACKGHFSVPPRLAFSIFHSLLPSVQQPDCRTSSAKWERSCCTGVIAPVRYIHHSADIRCGKAGSRSRLQQLHKMAAGH